MNAQTGEVTGVRVGTTRITATIRNAATGKYYTAMYTVIVTPLPASIGFDMERYSIGVNEKLAIRPRAYDANGDETGSTFTYKSSNAKVISIDEDGIMTARMTGTVTITVTAYNGIQQTVSVKAVAAPTAIKFQESTVNAVIGYESTLPAITLVPATAVGKISFTSDDEEIALVDQNGVITGIRAGMTTIRATTYNNKSAAVTVIVYNAPSTVRLSSDKMTLGEGQSSVLSYSFEEDQYSAITFSSDDESVATIDTSGRISALKAGNVNIIATAVNGVKSVCAITVRSAPANISFSQGSLTIGIGQVFNANDYVELPADTQASLTFKPESSSVLEYVGDGIIRGKSIGTTRVKVTTHNGKAALMTVKVLKAATSFSVEVSEDVLYEGAQFTLTPVFPASATALVSYESDNPDVVTVNEDGTAKALSAGRAIITATAHNGVKVNTELNVYRHVESISFAENSLDLTHYDTLPLEAIIVPEAVYDNTITWSSSDSEKVSVSEDGVLEALSITETPVIITAVSNDTGVSASCRVSVTPLHLSDIALSASELTLERDRSANVEVSFFPENADDTTVRWTSSAPSVATVDSEGNITAVASSGTAVISCVSKDGGIKKTVQVTAEKVHLTAASMESRALTVSNYDEMDIVYMLTPTDADIASAVWTVSNPAVLSVSQTGHVKALSVGKATVMLQLTDTFGAAYSCKTEITVEAVRVTAISMNPSEIHLKSGKSETVKVIVYPENAYNKKVSWRIKNKGIVSVESNDSGALILSGTKAGETVLVVTSEDGGYTAECSVKVFDALTLEAQPNFTHNTPGNDVVWMLPVQNALGDISYNISVLKDGVQILSTKSYDASKGIVVASCVEGTYELTATVVDSEGDTATVISAVTVDNAFTYTENGITWLYTIVSAQGGPGASVRLMSCPAGTTSITIPRTFDGSKVVRIETEAFLNHKELKQVIFPDTVTEIGARAFKGCTALSELKSY